MPLPGYADLRRSSFDDLPGWRSADLSAIWPVLKASARAAMDATPPLRPARAADHALRRFLRTVSERGEQATAPELRALFEDRLDVAYIAAPGFLTGYYEPIVEGSLSPSPEFPAPILPRPADLVTFTPEHHAPDTLEGYAAARRSAAGDLAPYADRAALEEWAIGPDARPLVWLRDWTEVFLVQVQGSARVRLPDGAERRLVYTGRNGHPYTSIGRLLVEAGEIAPAEMSLERLKAWLRTHGQAVGDAGRALMHRNRSYIFFAMTGMEGRDGPIGGAGLPLTPGVSIAIDRTLWSYGLPFWIETDDPVPGFGPEPLARVFVAQDTGSAIVGPARADLFLGSGDAAGHAAGLIRHPARLAVLLPKAS